MQALLLALVLPWATDINTVATELPKTHPAPFRVTSRATWDAEVDRLRAAAPKMRNHEVIVELARIVALIGEGHTRLNLPIDDAYGLFHPHAGNDLPKAEELRFRAIPVRFIVYTDGLFTSDGKQVTRIGTMSADDALAAVLPVAHGDNEMQRKDIAAGYLSVVEVLHARRVVPSLDAVPVTFADGTTVTYKPIAPPPPAPPRKPWSFEHLEREKAVWFDYHEVTNTPDEPLSRFAERMFRFIDEHDVDKLVIDLRNNYGGNHALNRALLHGVIRAKKLQAPGTLFVLVGRRTFSAAMMFAVELEKHAHAIFIGEPTGASPNGWGDPRHIVLPESGLTVSVSALYWQLSHPRDERTTLVPHVRVDPSRTGDPARAVALDFFGAPTPLRGKWRGTISSAYQRSELTIEDGRITCPALKMDALPLDQSPYPFALRAGEKRLAGTMTANGREFLVVAVRE